MRTFVDDIERQVCADIMRSHVAPLVGDMIASGATAEDIVHRLAQDADEIRIKAQIMYAFRSSLEEGNAHGHRS